MTVEIAEKCPDSASGRHFWLDVTTEADRPNKRYLPQLSQGSLGRALVICRVRYRRAWVSDETRGAISVPDLLGRSQEERSADG